MSDPLKRVTGVGGIFFKADRPEELAAWYAAHLGIAPGPDGYAGFAWREKDDPSAEGFTIWNPFPRDTKYFLPSNAPFMINYRVHDLDALLAALTNEGVAVEKREEGEYGKFAWIMDPEGNRIELWEPPPQA